MNCDDFLVAQETGGFLARRRARRHAARCPRCAALAAKFATAKQALATPEPLSPRARSLWKGAAEEPAARTPLFKKRAVLAGGLAATACVALLVFKLAGPKPGGTPTPEPHIATDTTRTLSKTVVEVIDPKQELDRLTMAVDRLDADMKKLRLDAERMEARGQVAMAFERFEKW